MADDAENYSLIFMYCTYRPSSLAGKGRTKLFMFFGKEYEDALFSGDNQGIGDPVLDGGKVLWENSGYGLTDLVVVGFKY